MKRFLMMMTLIGLVGNWNSTLTAQLVSPDSLYLNEDLPKSSLFCFIEYKIRIITSFYKDIVQILNYPY